MMVSAGVTIIVLFQFLWLDSWAFRCVPHFRRKLHFPNKRAAGALLLSKSNEKSQNLLPDSFPFDPDMAGSILDLFGESPQEELDAMEPPCDDATPLASLRSLIGYFKGVVFAHQVEKVVNFESVQASRRHAQFLFTLIKSDVQQRRAESQEDFIVVNTEQKLFPATYSLALNFINDILVLVREDGMLQPVASICRFLVKKEGLLNMTPHEDSLYTVREIVDIKRKVERSISSMLLVLVTWRSLIEAKDYSGQSDFLFFTKTYAEHLPLQEKHFVLLLFCRGIVCPPYAQLNVAINEEQEEVDARHVGAQALVRDPCPSLSESFKVQTKAQGISNPSSSYRMLFPFAALALRAYNTVYPKEECIAVSSVCAGDAALARFFARGASIDAAAADNNGLENSFQGLTKQVMRWLVDMNAVHFINNPDLNLKLEANVIPEELQANTVAMELLSTSAGLVIGRKENKVAYFQCQVRLGKLLTLLLHLFQEGSSADSARREQERGLSDGSDSYDAEGRGSQEDVGCIDDEVDESGRLHSVSLGAAPIANSRVLMTAIKIVEALPSKHPVRRAMDSRFALYGKNEVLVNDELQQWYDRRYQHRLSGLQATVRRRVRVPSDYQADDLWQSEKSAPQAIDYLAGFGSVFGLKSGRGGHGGKGGRDRETSSTSSEADDLFGGLKKGAVRQHKWRVTNSAANIELDLSGASAFIDSIVMRGLCSLLQVDEKLLLRDSHESVLMAQDVFAILTNWRNPMVLFDYYRYHNMYMKKSELSAVYCRYLRALFGLTTETVDQIRFGDAGNLVHLERFPPDVVQAWMDGYTTQGEKLPGYNDAQTLFMLGEDAQTCMMVRARQVNTNRALLSFVMHGNVRLIGRKDASGKMRQRAVVKLLIDKMLNRPVLYVESPVMPSIGFAAGPEELLCVYDDAAELGRLLSLPVVYCNCPKATAYFRADFELDALPTISNVSKQDLNPLIDYTDIVPFVWVEGLRNKQNNRFIDQLTPTLYPRAALGEVYVNGYRSPDTLEGLPSNFVDKICVEKQARRDLMLWLYGDPYKFGDETLKVRVEIEDSEHEKGYTFQPSSPPPLRPPEAQLEAPDAKLFSESEKKRTRKKTGNVSLQEMLFKRQSRINQLAGRTARIAEQAESAKKALSGKDQEAQEEREMAAEAISSNFEQIDGEVKEPDATDDLFG